MPSTIGKCKLFRIKHITLLKGETFLRNKHEIAFFVIKCKLFGRKGNTLRVCTRVLLREEIAERNICSRYLSEVLKHGHTSNYFV